MADKKALNDRMLKALKPARKGERYERMDKIVPGFGVRVTDKGKRTFILVARYPGSDNPTRRAIGEYGEITLERARDKARDWLALITKGVDPRDEEDRQRREEDRKRANSFSAVAEDFIAYCKRQKLRTADEMERNLRNVFIPAWAGRPVTDITSTDVRRIIVEPVERDATYQAFHLFALIRRLFNWAIGTDKYGLEVNPTQRLSTGDLIGERHARNRVLTDDELRALWRVTRRLPYPYGPLYRLLLLTGLRLNEACGATWDEVDLKAREWTIPATRMKKVKGGAKPHVVPLTDPMVEILESEKLMPRFKAGNHLFSHTHGKTPLKPAQFSDPKRKLDARLLRTLRAMARFRGENPKRVKLEPWVNHDIRRTVRTHLSALRVADEVREAVLAHVRPGIKGTYDKYQYLDEKREALELWSARLRGIVEPAPANVIHMRDRA